MKALISIFFFTAFITHIWTVIIAYSVGGFWACVVTFILPFLSELYWMFKMFGVNNTYAIISLIHLVLSLFFAIFGKSENSNY